MTKILVLDTETSGLFDFRKRAHEEGQPRMIELAANLCGEDKTDIDGIRYPIKPDGWVMNDELAEKLGHGLTTAFLTEIGVPVRDALDAYMRLYERADVIVAYGISFDTKVLRAELRRAGMPDLYGLKPEFCVMKACTPICKLPKARGGGFKYPKLGEAVKMLLGRELVNAHTAEADCLATVELYFYLKHRGVDVSGKTPESKLMTEGAGSKDSFLD